MKAKLRGKSGSLFLPLPFLDLVTVISTESDTLALLVLVSVAICLLVDMGALYARTRPRQAVNGGVEQISQPSNPLKNTGISSMPVNL